MTKNVIDLLDTSLLKVAAPTNKELDAWVAPLKAGCLKFGIDTVRELACLLSQAAHESADFTHLVENLNYNAGRLMQVWPKRFPTNAIAEACAHNPEKIANVVYANRMGNGDVASGDGWIYRGGGLFQLTGHDNYAAFARSVNLAPMAAADWVRNTKEGAAMSAAWFFHDRGLDALAATPGIDDETRAINGGLLGLADRKAKFDAVVAELVKRGA